MRVRGAASSLNGNIGKVYGNQTVCSAVTIPEGKKLLIDSGKSLTIGSGGKMTNAGVVRASGPLVKENSGTWDNTTTGRVMELADRAVSGLEDGQYTKFGASIPVGNFFIQGSVDPDDYTYSNHVLTINKETPLTISGDTTEDKIVVQGNVPANITLDGVNIQLNKGKSCAFALNDNATVTLTLANGSENTLKSAGSEAGLRVPTSAVLTIDGTGSLHAIGGSSDSAASGSAAGGAGIGGGGASNFGAGGTEVAIKGDPATFSTGGNGGNAFVMASTIHHEGDRASWCGLIFDELRGTAYTNETNVLTIPTAVSIPDGYTLDILAGDTLVFDGKAENSGVVNVLGTLKPAQDGWSNTSSGIVYLLKGGASTLDKNQYVDLSVENAKNPFGEIIVQGDGYTEKFLYMNHVLTFLQGGSYTVSMKEGASTISKDGIVISGGTDADPVKLTITDVKMDMTALDASAIIVNDSAVAEIILVGENELIGGYSHPGIGVSKKAKMILACDKIGKHLCDSSCGSLIAMGAIGDDTHQYPAVGIGGYSNSLGAIVINGGRIAATGIYGRAGIGCMENDNTDNASITIHGGVVVAKGGTLETVGAAGIGLAGYLYSDTPTTPSVTITGGVVTATGGKDAAGIGSGSRAYDIRDNETPTSVTITGGTVTATGDGYGAGIGGDPGGGDISAYSCGEITITGGTVIATGGDHGVGIGGGRSVISGKDGQDGTFVSENGNAFIMASSIAHQDNKDHWGGAIFEGENGFVYGSPTLGTDAEIPLEKTLTIQKDTMLTIATGVVLTNRGIIKNDGSLVKSGTLLNYGSIFPRPNYPTPPANTSATVEIDVAGETKQDGTAIANVQDNAITDSISNAQRGLTNDNAEQNRIAIVINVKTDKKATALAVTLSATSIDALIKSGVNQLTIKNDLTSVTLDPATQKALAGGEVQLNINMVAVTTLSKAAQTAIGERPVFQFALTSAGKPVTDFEGGRVGLRVPYKLVGKEQGEKLCGVYADDSGKITWMETSSYDQTTNTLLMSTTHFSTYGVGYRQNTFAFEDIDTHWAKDDIEFVAERGLLSGTSATRFSPNTEMTRGMFVTALGRLADVDVNNYKTSPFSDVKTDAYFAPYVAWAAKMDIVNGTTTTTFSPNQSITRQEMAVMIQNYSKAIGYKLQNVHAEMTFADSASIASWAADAVKQMQMSGILMGKLGNKFDATATATRAEASAMLRRFVALVIDTVKV